MLVDFNNISNKSKLIIFSSDKEISQNQFIKDLECFLDTWESHGCNVISACKIFFKYIVIVAVDESKHLTSGCSKDKCYDFFKKCQNIYGLNFFRRDLVYYLNSNDFIVSTISDFQKISLKDRGDFFMFNTMLKSKQEVDSEFKQHYKDSFWSRICH